MKKIIFPLLLTGALWFISCNKEKELTCTDCNQENKLPKARAGNDQITTLPKDSLVLDGSLSTDADGSIIAYQWNKISGPCAIRQLLSSIALTVKTALLREDSFFSGQQQKRQNT